MKNPIKQFKIKIWLIVVMLLAFGTIPCRAIAAEKSTVFKNFTNLVVFMKFSDEDEFVNNVYANTTVYNILDNTYNKSVYSVADYFETVSNGKMNMQTLYLFENGNSLTLSKPRGYYAAKDELNPYGYTVGEEYSRMYELQCDWANALSQAIANGNKPQDINGNPYQFADLDKNRDGKFDLVTIIYKNTVQNISVSWGAPLWDYESYSDMISVQEGSNTYQSGEYVQLTGNYDYLYHGEDKLPILSTGKLCHETMHALGLKDLYTSDLKGGVYFMSLMGKHLSPIGQYISVKERESLNWLDKNQIQTIQKDGTYQLSVASAQDGVIAYKRDLPSGKTLYLEYRRFDGKGNKYDTKDKELYSCQNGDLMKGTNLKSGLVCYLATTGLRFPSNLNGSSSRLNMEVVSHGQFSTMADCAVKEGEYLEVFSGNSELFIDVTKMTEDTLEFEISGIVQTDPQIDCSIQGDNLGITLQNESLGGTILVAEYDVNGSLLRLTPHAPQTDIHIPLLAKTHHAKVMWWNSLKEMIPVTASKMKVR